MGIEEKIVELSEKLESLMVEKAPEAWQLTLSTARIDAVESVVWGVGWLIVLLLAIWFTKRAWTLGDDAPHWCRGEARALTCFCSVISIIGSLVGAMIMLGPWTWVAFFEPKLWIAKRILDSLL